LIAESEPNTSQILPLIRALLHRDPEQRPSGHEAYEYLTVHAQDIAPVDHDCLHPSQSDGDTKH
jgi:serine/threonine protein kinase